MYSFEFTEQEANLILTALGELPAKASIGLITKLQVEAQKQPQSKQDGALEVHASKAKEK